MTPGRKSRLDLDRLLDMREAGHLYREIASELGTSIGNVEWHCMKAGVPRRNRLALKATAGRCRRYTEPEDQTISTLRMQGHSYAEIGRRTNRHPNSVAARLYTLAIYEEAAAA